MKAEDLYELQSMSLSMAERLEDEEFRAQAGYGILTLEDHDMLDFYGRPVCETN